MKPWPKVKLGEVVTAAERSEAPMPGTTYRQIGVKLWGEGAYEREAMDGSQTKYAHLFRAEANDIIVNKIWARNGSVAVVQEKLAGCFGSGEFPMFSPKKDRLEPRWMHWLTKTCGFWAQCDEKSQGTSGKNRIKPEQFLRVEMPLPPLPEQRRIVARIEQLAAQIHEARTLRHQAVEQAEALLQAAVEDFCFKKNFPVVPFGELLESASNGLYKPRHSWGSGLPCLRMYNIDGPSINRDNLQLLEVTDAEVDKYGCVPGDLIFNRVNSAELVGKTGIVPDDFPLCTFEAMNMRLRVKRESILPRYAAQILNAPTTKQFYRLKLKQQCGMASIHQGFVRSIPTPLPPLAQQHQIMAELAALQTEVDALKHLQSETAAELDALLPAILDRAFKGEL